MLSDGMLWLWIAAMAAIALSITYLTYMYALLPLLAVPTVVSLRPLATSL